MAIPTAAAGAIKAKTAAQMALFAKNMQKTDWDGVNNAMQSIKDFGASASTIQDTLGDINDMATSLVDIALGDTMAQIALKASELFDALEPIATAFANLTGTIDTKKLDSFIQNLRIFNALIENSDRALRIMLDWLVPIIRWIFGLGPPPAPPTTTTDDTFRPPPNVVEGF